MANAEISLHGIVDEIGKVKGALRLEAAGTMTRAESKAIADILATLDTVEEQVRGLCGGDDCGFCCPVHGTAGA